MAWFRKEKKARQPRRERLEIPADVWEKCEACGHTDIREKFERTRFHGTYGHWDVTVAGHENNWDLSITTCQFLL